MKNFKTELILLCMICLLFGYIIGYKQGKSSKLKEIVYRAKQLPEDKQYYSSQEIDYLIFNQ